MVYVPTKSKMAVQEAYIGRNIITYDHSLPTNIQRTRTILRVSIRLINKYIVTMLFMASPSDVSPRLLHIVLSILSVGKQKKSF